MDKHGCCVPVDDSGNSILLPTCISSLACPVIIDSTDVHECIVVVVVIVLVVVVVVVVVGKIRELHQPRSLP
jgi:hypothetical protein